MPRIHCVSPHKANSALTHFKLFAMGELLVYAVSNATLSMADVA